MEEEEEISEYIIKKLILFYKYNNEIKSIINDKNYKPDSPFYKNYYIIRGNWIKVFYIIITIMKYYL